MTDLDVDREHDLLVLAVVTSHPVNSLRYKLQYQVEVDFIFLLYKQDRFICK